MPSSLWPAMAGHTTIRNEVGAQRTVRITQWGVHTIVTEAICRLSVMTFSAMLASSADALESCSADALESCMQAMAVLQAVSSGDLIRHHAHAEL